MFCLTGVQVDMEPDHPTMIESGVNCRLLHTVMLLSPAKTVCSSQTIGSQYSDLSYQPSYGSSQTDSQLDM